MSKTVNESISEWLFYAFSDLKSAKLAYRGEIYHQVTFLSQQAAEKSLKAIIFSKNKKIPQIHSIFKLVDFLNLSKVLQEAAVFLDEFYLPSRYPDALPGSLRGNLPNQKEAKKALEIAENFYNLALRKTGVLPAEVY